MAHEADPSCWFELHGKRSPEYFNPGPGWDGSPIAVLEEKHCENKIFLLKGTTERS